MKVDIMAGGRGTRISSVASDIPKPMIKVGDKPVLEHEIESLCAQGFTDIIITVSHLGHIIMDYFGDGSKISPVTGKSFGVDIEYFFEDEPPMHLPLQYQSIFGYSADIIKKIIRKSKHL